MDGFISTAKTGDLEQKLMHESKPLGTDLVSEKIDPCRIPARMSETPQPVPGPPDLHPRRTRLELLPLLRRLGGKRSRIAARRGDDRYAPTDQIIKQCRRKLILALQAMVFDRDVPAIDIAHLGQPLAERGNTIGERVGRPGKDHPNEGPLRALLCVRAAKQDSMGAAIALPANVMNWRRLMGLLAGRGSNLTTDRGVFAQKSTNVREWDKRRKALFDGRYSIT